MYKLEFDKNDNVSVEMLLERLALEDNILTNLIETFSNVLPKLTAKIKDFSNFSSEEQTSELIKSISSNHKELNKKLQYVRFVDYNKTLVSVPEGFKGYLIDYLQDLNKLTPMVYKELYSILSTYSSMLSTFITNKDAKTSLKDETRFFAEVTKHRENMVKALDKYFPKDSDLSKAYLDKTISRFADLDDLVKEAGKVDKQHTAQNMKEAQNSVNKCVDLLNIVIANMNSGEINNVSGAASKNVSQGAYEVAKYVEFVSVYRYKVEQAVTSVNKLIEQLNSVIK